MYKNNYNLDFEKSIKKSNLEKRLERIEEKIYPEKLHISNLIYDKILVITALIYIVFANDLIGNLLPCYLRRAINHNLHTRHFLVIGFVFFTQTLNNYNARVDTLLFISFLGYLLFLMTIKTDPTLGFIGLTLTFILIVFKEGKKKYLTKINKRNVNRPIPDKIIIYIIKKYPNLDKYLTYLIITIWTIGFLMYLGRKKLQFKEKFSYYTFIFATKAEKCSIANNFYNKSSFLTRISYIKHIFN